MLLIYWFKNYSVYFFASRYFITAHFLMDDFAEKRFDLNTALPKSFIKNVQARRRRYRAPIIDSVPVP
jgi:hypothetical protein